MIGIPKRGSVANHWLAPCLLSSCLALASACGGDDSEGETPQTEASGGGQEGREGTEAAESASEAAEAEAQAAAARAHRDALAGTRVHLDLLTSAHLADVLHEGLYIDFGTPARMHYTMGRWHGGWGRDVQTEGRDFTRVGQDARLFFNWEQPGGVHMTLRGRPIGAQAVVAYLNGQRVGQIDFDGPTVANYGLDIESARVRVGENTLMFRAADARTIEGEEVSFEIDSLLVRASDDAPSEEDYVAPTFRTLVHSASVGSDERNSFEMRGDTHLRFYVDVPPSAQLSLGTAALEGTATGRVRVHPEGAEATELWTAEMPEGRFEDHLIDLSAFAGQVVELEMSVLGAGARGLLSEPAIVVPLPDTETVARAGAEHEARNVIVLLIDTLRASKLSAYNRRSRVRTPTLDSFAEHSALFEHAQAPENWTKPSVASVLTSLSPMTHNTKEQSSRLPDSALMVSEVFQQNGFATASFIANGYVSDRFGFDQGWDHYTNYIREERRTEAETVFGEAIRWIEAHREERFFTYIQTIDPHVPYDPPGEFLEMYYNDTYSGRISSQRRTGLLLEEAKRDPANFFTPQDRVYLEALHDAEISYHDRHFGLFLERLQELGLMEDLIFVVTSDHGEEFFEHGSFGHGHSIFQELLHVPAMVRWDGVIDPLRSAPTISTMDLAPTVLEASGVDIPEVFEGHSLLRPALGVPRPGPAIAFSDKLDDRRVATAAGYKLVVRGNLTWAMFNLRTDPGEQDQISDGARHPIALRYLRGLMGQYLGAADRGDWLAGGSGVEARVLPAAESQIDRELCEQLLALNYVDARCAALQ